MESLKTKNKQAEDYSSYVPDSTGATPGSVSYALMLEEVPDLDAFLCHYMEWQRLKKHEERMEEVRQRMTEIASKGIAPGQSCQPGEYITRFDWLLETALKRADVGQITEAEKLLDYCEPLVEPWGDDPNPLLTEVLPRVLRARLLWTRGSALARDACFDSSLSLYEELVGVAETVHPGMAQLLAVEAAGRHIDLAESGVDASTNLVRARDLLLRAGGESSTEPDVLVPLFKALRMLGDAAATAAVAARILPIATQGVALGIPKHELICALYLGRMETPREFRSEVGPFAPSLYAECKGISFDEAWQAIHGERLASPMAGPAGAAAVLIGSVVVYDEREDPVAGGQADIIVHEYIHSAVLRGQTYKSEGKWYRAKRDVPTAALWTYLQCIGRAEETNLPLPACLGFFVSTGMESARDDPGMADLYVERMLRYFELHGEETNAAYQCAAVLAGMMIELLGPADGEEMQSYVAHLKVTTHEDALQKARRRVPLEL